MKPGWRIVRLSDGSAATARRIGRAFVPVDEDGEVRLIASAVRCGVGLWAGNGLLTLAHQTPAVMVGSTGLWAVAAWRAGSPDRTTPQPETSPEAAPEADPAGEFLAQLHELMPGPGDRLHLTQLAKHIHGDETATGRIREQCAAARIPITTVRVRHRGSSTGIYARDLPPLRTPSPNPSQSPLPGVVAAGQRRQQQQQQRSATAAREGFWINEDSTNPARSTVHWKED
nr:hypothetical protein KPHV_60610 [Kitasatospora purpeofusca]